MGPSWPREGGRGNRKSTQIFENIKNVKVKMQNKNKRCFLNIGAIFSKIGGSTAGRLPRFYQQI
jgi:hypothetical protein